MLAKTHEQFAGTFVLGNLYGLVTNSNLQVINTDPISFASLSLGIFFGSLLTDLDSANSRISKFIPKFLRSKKSKGPNHRGVIHTPIFSIVFYLLLISLGGYFFLKNNNIVLFGDYLFDKIIKSFIIGTTQGMTAHLILDTMNPTGIAWLYPIIKKKFSILKIKTGSKQETMLRSMIKVINVTIIILIFKTKVGI